MKCIILAAGYATRLYPLTKNFPKPLLEVGGKPILDWLMDNITEVVDEVIVVTNHKFFSHFAAWAESKSYVHVIDDGTENDETRLGAVKDIQLAVEGDDDYFVMAGDNLIDFSLKPFIEYQRNIGTSCVMCYEEKMLKALQKTAVITILDDGTITSYEEKPRKPIGTLAVPPFYIYKAADIARIEEALEAGCGYDAPGSFAAWLSCVTPMHAWKMEGHRYDIGDISAYESAKKIFTKIMKD